MKTPEEIKEFCKQLVTRPPDHQEGEFECDEHSYGLGFSDGYGA